MIFSDIFKQSNQLAKFSPNGKYVANAFQFRVVVRDVKTLQIETSFSCLDKVNHLAWSPDSLFLLCVFFEKGIIQVWSIEDKEWTCKIENGPLSLVAARWSADSRHILCISEFKLYLSIWSLVDKSVSHIKNPKHSTKGISFTYDGKFMAVALRHDCKDHVSIFFCDGWELLETFITETNDLSDLAFAPNNYMLAIWDSKLECKVLIYSLDGRLMSSYSAYDYALGVKTVTWSPSGWPSNQMLAVGSYDQQVRILNNITWQPSYELKHTPKVTNLDVTIYQEVEEHEISASTFISYSRFVIREKPYQIICVPPDSDKPNPKLGVGTVLFNLDSTYLATINDNMPNSIWIWNLKHFKLDSIISLSHRVKLIEWDPKGSRLAACSGTNKIYLWSLNGCSSTEVKVEDELLVSSFKWNQSGNSLLLMSKDQMCLCAIT